MKSGFATALFIATALGAVAGPRCFAAGLVIYKDYSFDPDSQAELAAYSTDDHYSTVDNVMTPGGQQLRILASQEPIFIPQVGDHSAKPAAMDHTIRAAERRFPQFAARLEPIRRAWAAAPVATPTPALASKAPTPPDAVQLAAQAQSAPPAPDNTPPVPDHGMINKTLHTKTGETLQSWRVTGMEGNNVVISHADGISRVPITDLPDNLYGFPAAVLDRAEQLRQAQQTAQTAAANKSKAPAVPAPSRTPAAKQPGRHGPHPHKSPQQSQDWTVSY